MPWKVGKDVIISPKASIYGRDNIEIGDNVRIDDFVILSGGTGGIKLGSHIHLAAGDRLYAGASGIEMQDLSWLSPGVTIFADSDSYDGNSLIGPIIPMKYKPTYYGGKVTISSYAIIGTHSVVLPGVLVGAGAAVGANSVVKEDLLPWGIYAGSPAKWVKGRESGMIELAKQFLEEYNNG